MSKKLIAIFFFQFVLIVILFAGFAYLFTQTQSVQPAPEVVEERTSTAETQSICDTDCKEEISKQVEKAISELDIEPASGTVVKEVVSAPQQKATSYIPLGNTFSTSSKDWVDVSGTEVYVDVENDYSKDATVSWEGSLKVAHGNGMAFARLYDDTNKIAVDFSELTTENNSDYKQVTSGNLPFWRGRNLYKIQIKSLNGFEVTYTGGKIKIVH